jgi:hypothetical protein
MKFCVDFISLVFLLNRRYTPFYKWIHRAVRDLPVLGEQTHSRTNEIITTGNLQKKEELIEELCAAAIEEMRKEDLTDSQSDFLLDHAHSVHQRIQDRELRERFSLTN